MMDVEITEEIETLTDFFHPIITERFHVVENLYLIRKQHRRRYGFLQADFISIIFGPMLPSIKIRTDSDIQIAANAWCDDPLTAARKYGHISKWNTSRVTIMNSLFYNKSSFNDDISKWNVSNVTCLNGMFDGATSFHCDISRWNISNLTNFCMISTFQNCNIHHQHKFHYPKMKKWLNGHKSRLWDGSIYTAVDLWQSSREECINIYGDISTWDVSKVTSLKKLFSTLRNSNMRSFNGDISEWDVSSVTNMTMTFYGDIGFNGNLSKWDVSSVTNMSHMFHEAVSFNGNISEWDVSSVTNVDVE
jgi:surface protein